MQIATKLELAGNVWRHFGTSSTHYFTVGPNADPKLVMDRIHETLTSEIQDYNIPENVKNRFDCLAAGDVSIKEHLLQIWGRSEARCAVSGRTAGTKAVGQQHDRDDLVSDRRRGARRNNLPVAPLGRGRLAYIEEQARSSPSQRVIIITAVAEASPAAIRSGSGRYRATRHRPIGTGPFVARISDNLDTRARPDGTPLFSASGRGPKPAGSLGSLSPLMNRSRLP
jgi:hypothetical protein